MGSFLLQLNRCSALQRNTDYVIHVAEFHAHEEIPSSSNPLPVNQKDQPKKCISKQLCLQRKTVVKGIPKDNPFPQSHTEDNFFFFFNPILKCTIFIAKLMIRVLGITESTWNYFE